jgi:hypothetical protein
VRGQSSAAPTWSDAPPIEHGLFPVVTQIWRGRPLVSQTTIVRLIAATATQASVSVRSQLDTSTYPKGVKVTDDQMDALNLHRHGFHGEWNSSIRPLPISPQPFIDRP